MDGRQDMRSRVLGVGERTSVDCDTSGAGGAVVVAVGGTERLARIPDIHTLDWVRRPVEGNNRRGLSTFLGRC